MKFIIALLILVNFAVFLFAGNQRAQEERYSFVSSPDVNLAGMRVVGESLVGSNNNHFGLDDKSLAVLDVFNEAHQEEEKTCFRIGPFYRNASLYGVTSWLQEMNIGYKERSDVSREIVATRVFLGPFESVDEAKKKLEDVKANSLEAYIAQSDYDPIISLGYFFQKQSAERFISQLSELSLDVKTQIEYRLLPQQHWVETIADSHQAELLSGKSFQRDQANMTVVSCSSLMW